MDKEFISLLYIYESKTTEDLSKFSKLNGFILQECDNFIKGCDRAKSNPPDLILIDLDMNKSKVFERGMKALLKIQFNFKSFPKVPGNF